MNEDNLCLNNQTSDTNLKEKIYLRIEEGVDRYSALPFFEYLKNDSIDPVTKMRPVAIFMLPMLLAFPDAQNFLQYKAQSSSSYDSIQKKISSHADEEKEHFTFIWNDLKILGLEKNLPLSAAINITTDENLSPARQFWFKIVDFNSKLSSLEMLASMEVSERTSFNFFSMTARSIKLSNGELEYFGKRHLDAESAHENIGGAKEHKFLSDYDLKPSDFNGLIYSIEQTFWYHSELINSLHEFCLKDFNFT